MSSKKYFHYLQFNAQFPAFPASKYIFMQSIDRQSVNSENERSTISQKYFNKKTFSTHSFIFECIEENWLKEKIKDMCNVAH